MANSELPATIKILLKPNPRNEPPFAKEFSLKCLKPPAKALELFGDQLQITLRKMISAYTLRDVVDVSIARASAGNREVIIKSFSNKIGITSKLPRDLWKEAKRYEELQALQGEVIPHFFGLFKGIDGNACKYACIITEYCGEPLNPNLSCMDEKDLKPFLGLLHKLHRSGYRLRSYDYAGKDVVQKEDGSLRFVAVLEFKKHANCNWDGKEYIGGVLPPRDEIGCNYIAQIFDEWGLGETEPIIFIRGVPWPLEGDRFPSQDIIDLLIPEDYISFGRNKLEIFEWMLQYPEYEDEHPGCTPDDFKKAHPVKWTFQTQEDIDKYLTPKDKST